MATADAMQLAAVHSVIQKQLHEQKQRQAQQQQQGPAVMLPPDRRSVATRKVLIRWHILDKEPLTPPS